MPLAAPRSMSVALVGRCLRDNENLGLGYLEAAVAEAGLPCERYTLNRWTDLAPIAGALRQNCTPLVGIALPDGGSALLPLALGELLRREGFAGHITAGGPFATLARGWLLNRYPWLDSVVRHAGEVPLVGLARALAAGGDGREVPGVTTRAGDGLPAPVLDETPLRLRPARGEPPRLLGHGVAHVMATRGCAGRCTFCGPAALQIAERREARAGGATAPELDAAGVGGVRRRSLDDLCDEIAWLWRDRDVRYFYFVDEHLLPYDEAGALGYLAKLRAGLRARRVGRLGLGAMLRADRLTPAIARAFADAGLVRVFVGIELASDAEARRFGRRTDPAQALSLVADFDAAGVATVCNLMLVHPDATPSTVAHGLDLVAALPAGLFEATRMMVYHGTRLRDRLAREGRLTGNPLRYGYTFADPVMERFSVLHARLRAEAFWNHSLAHRTHDAFLALALERRLEPSRVPRIVATELEAIRKDVNRLYTATLRRALALAVREGSADDADALVDGVRRDSLALGERLEDLAARLARIGGGGGKLFAPLGAAAASAIAFAVLGTSSGCHRDSLPGAGDPGVDGACTPAIADVERTQVTQRLARDVPCFDGNLRFAPVAPVVSDFPTFWNTGSRYLWFGVPPCGTASDQAQLAQLDNDVRAAVAEVDTGCLPAAPYTNVTVHGGIGVDVETMSNALLNACGHADGMIVILDAAGRVVDVTANGGTPPQVDCVRTALQGLTFPCLAGYHICPEYVILE